MRLLASFDTNDDTSLFAFLIESLLKYPLDGPSGSGRQSSF